jgi:DNA polymerase III sliding clamp (beta) subunit (PCNA family)
MDITLPKESLVHMLSTAGEVVDVKSGIPALGCLYLFATQSMDGHLTVEGSDLNSTIRCSGKATVNEAGSTLIPKLFVDFARAMPDGDVRLYHEPKEGSAYGAAHNGTICMRSVATSRRYSCGALNGQDWPREKIAAAAPATTEHVDIEVPTEIAVLLLKCAVIATGDDVDKPQGVTLLKWGDKSMFSMGCDGHRLAIVKRPIDDDGRGELRMLKRSAKTMAKLLEANAKAHPVCRISVGNDGKWFSVELGDTIFYDRQMPGVVPYDQVTPSTWGTLVRMQREALVTLIKAVSVESETEIILHVGEDKVEAGCKVDGTRREIDEIPILQIERSAALGKKAVDRTIGFKPRFLLEAVDKMLAEEVVMSVTGPESPMMIYPGDDSPKTPLDSKHLALVMPLRF